MDKFKDSLAIRHQETESQVYHNSRCISYFNLGANAFSVAKSNFVVHNIMLFLT